MSTNAPTSFAEFLAKVVTTVTVLFISYVLCIILYRIWLSPLARFPGPKLAALTGLYEAYYDVFHVGQYYLRITELHERYGKNILAANGANLLFCQVLLSESVQMNSIFETASFLRRFMQKTQ